MLNKGDKYIHFTKYGGTNIGVVEEYQDHVYTHHEGVTYISPSILTTKGVRLKLDGSDGRIYKVVEGFYENKKHQHQEIFRKLQNKRDRKYPNQKIHFLDENEKT